MKVILRINGCNSAYILNDKLKYISSIQWICESFIDIIWKLEKHQHFLKRSTFLGHPVYVSIYHGCAGWAASLLFAYDVNMVSHDEAHIDTYLLELGIPKNYWKQRELQNHKIISPFFMVLLFKLNKSNASFILIVELLICLRNDSEFLLHSCPTCTQKRLILIPGLILCGLSDTAFRVVWNFIYMD